MGPLIGEDAIVAILDEISFIVKRPEDFMTPARDTFQ
jgi:hypothetical protein